MSAVLDRLRDLPVTYDVVIGDFGREAATRYLNVLAVEERSLLSKLLVAEGLPFFDEYRRIMFSHVGDVSFLKGPMIGHVWETRGHLTDEVLVAVSGHAVQPELVMAMVRVIRGETMSALTRGHQRVRATIVCNTLSDALEDAVRIVNEDLALTGGRVTAHGVVGSSVATLARHGMLDRTYAVIGTEPTRAQYGQLGMKVLSFTGQQQAVIDEAIVASIAGKPSVARAYLESLVASLRRDQPGLVVLEACTDLNVGVGLDSVRLMAEHMVHECYGSLA